MLTPSGHGGPLHRKPRLKVFLTGAVVVVVVVGAALPPDHVSAVAQVVGTTTAEAAVVVRGTREEGLMRG